MHTAVTGHKYKCFKIKTDILFYHVLSGVSS